MESINMTYSVHNTHAVEGSKEKREGKFFLKRKEIKIYFLKKQKIKIKGRLNEYFLHEKF